MKLKTHKIQQAGFTLLEILIVVFILIAVMAIAIPAFKNIGVSNAVKSDARKIKDELARARIEAIERNSFVTVVFRQVSNDFVVFIDSNPPDHSYAGTETTLRVVGLASSVFDAAEGGGDGIDIGGNAVTWDTKGISYSGTGGLSIGSFYVIGSDGTAFRVVINQTGNVRIEAN